MTIDNLLSGLLGALVGAIIVVRAEQWRWRRENRAAARLLYYEVVSDRIWLNSIVQHAVGPLSTMLTRSVWEAQQVRVASLLHGDDLNRIAAAYLGLANLLSTRSALGDEIWMKWLTSNDSGKKQVAGALTALDYAETILSRAMDEKPWAEKRWLAVHQHVAGVWNATTARVKKLRP